MSRLFLTLSKFKWYNYVRSEPGNSSSGSGGSSNSSGRGGLGAFFSWAKNLFAPKCSCRGSLTNKDEIINQDASIEFVRQDCKCASELKVFIPQEFLTADITVKGAFTEAEQFCNCILKDLDEIVVDEETQIKIFDCACNSKNALGMQPLLGITNSEVLWLKQISNWSVLDQVCGYVKTNNYSEEAKGFAKEAIKVLENGTAEEKKVATAILNDDITGALDILLKGAKFKSCPPDCDEIQFDAPVVLTAQIINGAFDGAFNLFLMIIPRSKDKEGEIIRELLTESGTIVPADVSNVSLKELFELRVRGRILTVETANQTIKDHIVDLGITLVDLAAIASPGSGGGAYLFVKAGAGKITATSITAYLKALSKGNWKTVNESMSDAAKSYQSFISGKPWNQSFVLNDVKFDSLKNGILGDAKSGMLNFIDSNANFKPFFTGQTDIIKQAIRQRAAAGDLPIEWHFEHNIILPKFRTVS